MDPAVTELCSRMTNVANPFMGAMVAVEARNIQVRPSKKHPDGLFCKPHFIHYPGNPITAQAILAMPAVAQIPMAEAGRNPDARGYQTGSPQPQPYQPPGPQAYAQRPPVPPPGQAWGAPPPPPPPAKVRPPNLPPSYIRADGAWWDGQGWNT
jgi:hypothetical protein